MSRRETLIERIPNLRELETVGTVRMPTRPSRIWRMDQERAIERNMESWIINRYKYTVRLHQATTCGYTTQPRN